jgi:hypothetical protein
MTEKKAYLFDVHLNAAHQQLSDADKEAMAEHGRACVASYAAKRQLEMVCQSRFGATAEEMSGAIRSVVLRGDAEQNAWMMQRASLLKLAHIVQYGQLHLALVEK